MLLLAAGNSTDDKITTRRNKYSAPFALLVHSPDVHEIRAYNRLGRAANGPFVAFIQDDDRPNDPNWLARALKLFKVQPKMSMLGGHAGRLDTSKNMEVKRQWEKENPLRTTLHAGKNAYINVDKANEENRLNMSAP